MTASEIRPGFDEALTAVRDVEGWMTDAQAQRLWNTAQSVPPGGRIVEIGSFRGRSTIIIGRAAAPDVELVAIDPHGGMDRGPNEYDPNAALGNADYDTFHANLTRAGVEGRIHHVRKASDEAMGDVTGELDMLYIDGAHRYRFAKPDIERWGPRVRPGGTMLIHDSYNAVGVMLAQLRLLFGARRFRYVGRSGSLAEYRAEADPMTTGERVQNAARQALELPYFVRNCVVKLALVARLRPLARLLGEQGHWPY